MRTVGKLELRTYQKGDAAHMAAVFNAVMRGEPGFQEDSAERLEQVYAAPTFDPESKQIALLDGRFVGYMTTTPDPSDPTRGNVNKFRLLAFQQPATVLPSRCAIIPRTWRSA